MRKLITISIFLLVGHLSFAALNPFGIIYGTDDRREIEEIENEEINLLSGGVLGLVSPKAVQDQLNGYSKIKSVSIEIQMDMCPDEKFKEQEAAMFCTAFLVGPKTIVTAGHCIESQMACENTKFVFGYAKATKGQPYNIVPNKDIYSCNKLIHTEHNPEQQSMADDFAVIELDREVEGRPILSIEKNSQLNINSPLFVVGHPLGLPLKYSDNAWVRGIGPKNYLNTNLDTYVGSSGSPVFNPTSLKVEGILVDGDQDLEKTDAGCYKSKACPDDGCNGELVLKIAPVLKYLR